MFIRVITAAILLAALGFVLWLKPSWQRNTFAPQIVQVDPVIPVPPLALPVPTCQPDTGNTQPALAIPESVTEEAIDAQFADIADQFAELIQYPTSSLPIFNAEAVEKYLPNQSFPIRFEENGVTLSLRSERLQYSPNEPIRGVVSVAGLDQVQGTLQVLQAGQTIANLSVTVSSGPTSFEIPPLGQRWMEAELQLVASVKSAEQEWTVSTPIQRFDSDNATIQLLSAEKSFVDGSWLVMPMIVDVSQPGFFRLEANLYSANSRKPLIHLSAEQELNRGEQTLNLAAHISALKAMNDPGDYLLRDFALEQMPGPPDFEAISGLVAIPEAKISGHPFGEYDDAPYVDDEALARLEFLQQVTSR
ncbi:hypothetical protein [Reinekea sp. G2M2-21]|uniref:hypothetical protein n=1 Tax=Reinekea sp. G2M2-21 TaxID=2788942 RepID=UPI0018AB2CA2|nr:hypothetical protein [Reinekea sp. G2M2-21]